MEKKIILFLIIAFCLSCNNKFEKKWNIGIDYEYPYREKILNEFLNNNDLKGKNVSEILNLLRIT